MTGVSNPPISGAGDRDGEHEGRDRAFMDVDRMVNEGLGAGRVSAARTGLVDSTTTDDMEDKTQG